MRCLKGDGREPEVLEMQEAMAETEWYEAIFRGTSDRTWESIQPVAEKHVGRIKGIVEEDTEYARWRADREALLARR